jgi:DNA polymerase zeta
LPKIAGLIRSGAILNTKFEIFEAHIPFLLQVFVDYNLYGMGYINLQKINFRSPIPKYSLKNIRSHQTLEFEQFNNLESEYTNSIPVLRRLWIESNTPKELISSLKRQTTCQLEVDALMEGSIFLFYFILKFYRYIKL